MSWGLSGMLKNRSGMHMVSKGLHSCWFQRYFNSNILKCDFQLPTKMGVYSNINFSSWLYSYANLNYYKYLKSETHLRNVQENKTSSVIKRIVKICLVVDTVRKNWSWIVVASCRSHYFVSARFGSFWVFANLITTKRFKYRHQ